ncbi:MAG: type II toxin-antitoxin system HipA family toxin [bacterium]|nr:type II toxin-antitoxin system HipA family toxin [bacterium]MDE0288780.1 type II toxin-antitoxin system HipA family toxin [bacterium]MDE0438666.1 type II toxin-antitoxin system HipA family toxin [bacterium]
MTTSDRPYPTNAFVWVWPARETEPVVAGRLLDRGPIVTFVYGRSYLQRPDAVALYVPELPLQPGEMWPLSGELAGCVADAAPDAWGRRVIEHRRTHAGSDLSNLAYLLESGSDRIGALDFQESATRYTARSGDAASLEELAEAAERVEWGVPLTPTLERALLHGTSVGGARPKALLTDGPRRLIAKFASSADSYPVVKAEYVAMELARRAGIDAAPVELAEALGKDVLLVERFDRTVEGHRRMMVSALTILELHDAHGIARRYATYTDLAHQVRSRFSSPDVTLRELFARIVFNILVGNTDDHARNHSAFWDGAHLTLTSAYDICPQARTGGEATQAMAFGADGDRLSQVARCIAHAGHYHLTAQEAREIIDHLIDVIRTDWDEVCDLAAMAATDRQRLWGRQFLNPYALYGYKAGPAARTG